MVQLLYNYNFNSKLSLLNYVKMETVINKFKIWSGLEGLKVSNTFCYIESAKGLYGVFLKVNDTPKPLFCKIRSPSYHHLFWLSLTGFNYLLTDLVTLIGTIDIVFGEIDR